MIGRTIAHYEVLGELGAGGMGVVYRARDSRLAREVAIKTLPADFAQDTGKLARFEREAKVLASLNHPHIGAIYGLEEADEERFLILELVEGESLSDRIARGLIPVLEALELVRQITEALEAAHEKGVIHRDLKPGNIKMTPDGSIKVLDFGLAKTLATRGASSPDFTQSPTLTHDSTKAGVILGTAGYMSPEQVRGMPADERTDIWAFGCVLFEALTATRAFPGETEGDTTAAILDHEPDWSLLPEATPGQIRVLLKRCLRKDLKRRLHHISDARIEIEDALGQASTEPSSPVATLPRKWSQRSVGWSLAVFAALTLAVTVWILSPRDLAQLPSPTRLAITLPPGQSLAWGLTSSFALSPDGTQLVYAADRSDLSLGPQLFLRALDRYTAKPVAGTEGASTPFFSPDGRWIGFFARGKLWKVPVAGGVPVPICDAATVATGATWAVDGTIIFTVFGSGLRRVSAHGGQAEELTTPDSEKGELGHSWPQVLPNENGILFGIVFSEGGRIVVMSPETGRQHEILLGSHVGRYLPTGHFVYRQLGGWWAVPFDLAELKTDGTPAQILDNVGRQFTVSDTGSMVYGVNPTVESTLVWVDRKGQASHITEVPGRYGTPRLSPDGRRIAVTSRSDIWIYDLKRGTRSPLTVEGRNTNPVWTPDGTRIAFASTGPGSITIYWKPIDGSGEAEPLLEREPYPQFPLSWSPDGQVLLFTEVHPETGSDLWLVSTEGDRHTSPVVTSEFGEWGAELSPDGNWLAYVSDDSGRWEVFVRRFLRPGGRWRVSDNGGNYPVWSADGRELFYSNGDRIMRVKVETESAFSAGRPQMLFEGPFTGGFDVAPDGQRFVMTRRVEGSGAPTTELRVVLNWFQELEGRVPIRKAR